MERGPFSGPLCCDLRALGDDLITPRWQEMSPAARAEAYSPSSMVGGDLTPFVQAYRDQSAAAYAAGPEVHTLAYGRSASQTLDLVKPALKSPVALHIFVHGGYWQELSKKDSFFAAPGTLSQSMAFAALDYTLAPEAGLDSIVAEVVAALRFLRAQGKGLGIDDARIVVSGSSAGAHLAAMACLELGAQEQPAGLILMSGIYDLRPLLGTYVNDALGMDEATAIRNSPAMRDVSGMPACGIAWAVDDTDEFKRQSRQFAKALQRAGRNVQMMEVAGRNHFDIVHDLTGTSDLAGWLPQFSRKIKR